MRLRIVYSRSANMGYDQHFFQCMVGEKLIALLSLAPALLT